MNIRILGFMAIGLMAGSMAANAQVTYDYNGAPTTITITGDLPPPTNPNGPGLTGDVVLASALNPNQANQVVTPLSYSFAALSSATVDQSNQGVVASFDFSTVNGKITSWDVELNSGTYASVAVGQYIESITPQGDVFTYTTHDAACGSPGEMPGDCFTATSTSTAPGTWTSTAQAPEISPASAASGLTLLLGGLAVIRGRRKVAATTGLRKKFGTTT
jgi:hypothetical protein